MLPRRSLLPSPRPTARHSWDSSRDHTQCLVRGFEGGEGESLLCVCDVGGG